MALCIGSENERNFKTCILTFEFNIREHSNLKFLNDVLLRHKKLQLEYQKGQVWSETLTLWVFLMVCLGVWGFFLIDEEQQDAGTLSTAQNE